MFSFEIYWFLCSVYLIGVPFAYAAIKDERLRHLPEEPFGDLDEFFCVFFSTLSFAAVILVITSAKQLGDTPRLQFRIPDEAKKRWKRE